MSTRIEGYAPPGIEITGQFTLENTGVAALSYSISSEEPAVRSPSKYASMSTLRSAAVDRSPRPTFESVDRDAAIYAAEKHKGRPAVQIQGNDVLMHDDGNHIPDQFWGFPDTTSTFFWGNHFILDDFDFTLEKVQFYARTEDVTETVFWIGIYRSPFILNLFAGQFVSVITSPEGAWYEVDLETPLSFRQGAGIFIELSAPPAVLSPAGVDAGFSDDRAQLFCRAWVAL